MFCGSACSQVLEAELKQLRREAKAAQSLVLKDELKSRRRVLRRLGYVTEEGVVTDKGDNSPLVTDKGANSPLLSTPRGAHEGLHPSSAIGLKVLPWGSRIPYANVSASIRPCALCQWLHVGCQHLRNKSFAGTGRAAAEIQSADELVVTELMFNGVFSALNPEQITALTSCFVWTEKSDVGVKVRRAL